MRLTFLGATMIVTGSSFLLEAGGKKFLVDCGMFQGSKAVTALNSRGFAYNPADIDAVILTHAHIDHSGLLPRLCREGFKGPIYATKATTELCGIMLPDSAHIQEFDAEIANRKGKRAGNQPVEPLYTVNDAANCLRQFTPVEYGALLSPCSEVAVRFRDAGHMLGSSMIEVWVTEQNERVKLVFTGDLGQPDQPIIRDPAHIEEADYIIMESTYGNRIHEFSDSEEDLAEAVNDTIRRGGNIVIPAFAVGRTQTLLYYLNRLFKARRIPDIPVIIDSPLAISATDIFNLNPQEYDREAYKMLEDAEHPFIMPQLMFAKTAEESKAINSMDQPVIIISASGMADAGRVLHHLKHNLWRPESSVLLVGYQAQGSLGRRLQDGVKRVKILGEEISVRARIYTFDGLSAHADRDQLLGWLANLKRKPSNIFVVHGEPDMAEPFARLITERFGFSSYVPRYGDSAEITGKVWEIKKSTIDIGLAKIQELQLYLYQLEQEYAEMRSRVLQLAASDSNSLSKIMEHLKLIRALINKD